MGSLRANGTVKQRKPRTGTPGAQAAVDRIESLEFRSYEAEYVHGLSHLDFHHGSRRVLEPDGRWIKPVLLGVMDDHSRLDCHFQWYRRYAKPGTRILPGTGQEMIAQGVPHRQRLCHDQ